MIWRWGKSGVISNLELGMLLILQCVVLVSFLSTTVAWHHSRPAPSAPSSVPSPPFRSPSAQSPVPSPPFCSRSVVTTIGSAFLALASLMIYTWYQGRATVAFSKQNDVPFWKFWKKTNLRGLLWTIVLALNPIVCTFYVLQTMFVTRKFRNILKMAGMEDGGHTYEIAKDIADSWVAVGVRNPNSIHGRYNLNRNNAEAKPDPDLVLNLAGTGDPRSDRQWPDASSFHFFLLNYDGMLALLRSKALAHADREQLRFLGSRTGLEVFIIVLQSMSYITAVVYRRIQHLHVAPIEAIGFTGSLVFLVYALVQYCFGSLSNEGLLIYLTPAQEQAIENFGKVNPLPHWYGGMDADRRAFKWTSIVGSLVIGVATWLVYPVLKYRVDLLGHIIFFGDFLLQFILLWVYFRERSGLGPLLIPAIITVAGVVLAIVATSRHWHDQNFDIPTPSLGRYLPFIH